MNTARMMRLKSIKPNRFLDLLDRANALKRSFDHIYKAIDSQVMRDQVVDVVENYYDIGKVKYVYEVFGGYTNRSFAVICIKDGQEYEFFIRKYKISANDQDVMMEHKLIKYAIKQGFKEASDILHSKSGDTFVKIMDIVGGKPIMRAFAVYNYLEGEDKYTWIDNNITPKELFNLGALLGRLHNCTRDFQPEELSKAEPKIEYLMLDMKRILSDLAEQPLDSKFHDFFRMSLPRIFEIIDKNIVSPEVYAKMPQTPVHGDYHAGNVKFCGEDTVGLFDFDWSKIDVRLFDVCLGILYCCSSWHVATDGQLRMDDCHSFLKGYNSVLGAGGLEKLNETECHYFSTMMSIASLYLVYWCTALWYYQDPEATNDYESIYYLIHLTRCMEWIECNKKELSQLLNDID